MKSAAFCCASCDSRRAQTPEGRALHRRRGALGGPTRALICPCDTAALRPDPARSRRAWRSGRGGVGLGRHDRGVKSTDAPAAHDVQIRRRDPLRLRGRSAPSYRRRDRQSAIRGRLEAAVAELRRQPRPGRNRRTRARRHRRPARADQVRDRGGGVRGVQLDVTAPAGADAARFRSPRPS